MSKHEAMQTYLINHISTLTGCAFAFNFSDDTVDAFGFFTQYADKDVKKYIRVGAIREYGFEIRIVKNYSSNTDDINLQAMNFAQDFNDWVEEQNRIKNYPDFGDKCEIQKIESLQNMPNLVGTSEDESKAYYMLQCKVTYFEKY